MPRHLPKIGGLLIILASLSCTSCSKSGEYVGLGGLMESLAPPSPTEAARDAFNVYDADRRRRAINLLSNASWGGEAPYLRTYRLLADDPDPTVRAACITALSRHGTSDDIAVVLIHLEDESGAVRWESAKALQRIHSDTAIEPLIARLAEDQSADVRMACAKAIGQYNKPQVFHSLVGSLNDADFGVITESAWSLHIMTGLNYGNDGSQWLAWSKKTDNLFQYSKPYAWKEYKKPPGFFSKIIFWKKPEKPQPQTPRGMENVNASDQTSDQS